MIELKDKQVKGIAGVVRKCIAQMSEVVRIGEWIFFNKKGARVVTKDQERVWKEEKIANSPVCTVLHPRSRY
jgi:hypothetical protein